MKSDATLKKNALVSVTLRKWNAFENAQCLRRKCNQSGDAEVSWMFSWNWRPYRTERQNGIWELQTTGKQINYNGSSEIVVLIPSVNAQQGDDPALLRGSCGAQIQKFLCRLEHEAGFATLLFTVDLTTIPWSAIHVVLNISQNNAKRCLRFECL